MIRCYFEQIADSISSLFDDFDELQLCDFFGDRFIHHLREDLDKCKNIINSLEDV